MQFLSHLYLIRQQELMMFLLYLVYPSAVVWIPEEIKVDPCWRNDILRVKGRKNNLKMLLSVGCRNRYEVIEWTLFDAPARTHGVFTSITLS